MAIWFQHVRRFLMICGNISNFFLFLLVWFSFFSFPFFLICPPLLCFGPLRILCLKEIEAIELILTLSCFTKAFHYLKTKPKKSQNYHCFLQPVRNTWLNPQGSQLQYHGNTHTVPRRHVCKVVIVQTQPLGLKNQMFLQLYSLSQGILERRKNPMSP